MFLLFLLVALVSAEICLIISSRVVFSTCRMVVWVPLHLDTVSLLAVAVLRKTMNKNNATKYFITNVLCWLHCICNWSYMFNLIAFIRKRVYKNWIFLENRLFPNFKFQTWAHSLGGLLKYENVKYFQCHP